MLYRWTSMRILSRLQSTKRAVLKEVTLANGSYRPFESAFDQQYSASRREAVHEEFLISWRQLSEFQTEVTHDLDHQAILICIMHVVDLELRVTAKQRLAQRDKEFNRATRIIGI